MWAGAGWSGLLGPPWAPRPSPARRGGRRAFPPIPCPPTLPRTTLLLLLLLLQGGPIIENKFYEHEGTAVYYFCA